MTLFEALPVDITEALYHYCKDDECLNDAMLRALRNKLKIDQVEHNKYSHNCLRCDKFKELEKENAELKKRNGELAGQKASLERWFGEAKSIIKGLLSLKSTVSSAKDAENRFSVRERAEEFLKECQ